MVPGSPERRIRARSGTNHGRSAGWTRSTSATPSRRPGSQRSVGPAEGDAHVMRSSPSRRRTTSDECSASSRKCDSDRARARDASTSLVTSRNPVTRPTIPPSPSATGLVVCSNHRNVPSDDFSWVRPAMTAPSLTRSFTDRTAPERSGCTKSDPGRPTASSGRHPRIRVTDGETHSIVPSRPDMMTKSAEFSATSRNRCSERASDSSASRSSVMSEADPSATTEPSSRCRYRARCRPQRTRPSLCTHRRSASNIDPGSRPRDSIRTSASRGSMACRNRVGSAQRSSAVTPINASTAGLTYSRARSGRVRRE